MKLFQKVNMASETIHSAMRSGVVFAGSTKVAGEPGDLVVPTGLAESDVYTGKKDFNTFVFKAPVSANATDWKDRNLMILDPVKVPTAKNGDLVYRMGVKTLGLAGEEGEVVAARKLFLNDQFLLGLDNLEKKDTTEVPSLADVKIGDYYTATGSNKFTHKNIDPETLATKECYVVRVEDKVKISQGVGSVGVVDAILVTVVSL